MDKANQALHDSLGGNGWKLEKPKNGMQKECYLARSSHASVFIKFGVTAPILQRLGEINVAPRLLASGRVNGEPFVVQELVEGVHPDRSWIKGHLEEVAKLITTYHDDKRLTELLSEDQTLDYAKHISSDIYEIEQQVRSSSESESLQGLFLDLKRLSGTFERTSLVPVHNEPNTTNMLLSPNGLRFIDWDEIVLSDPIRDIGPFLWWYANEDEWAQFFEFCHIMPTDQLRAKVYWFAARASLVVYLWSIRNARQDSRFLRDFTDALSMRPNSRA